MKIKLQIPAPSIFISKSKYQVYLKNADASNCRLSHALFKQLVLGSMLALSVSPQSLNASETVFSSTSRGIEQQQNRKKPDLSAAIVRPSSKEKRPEQKKESRRIILKVKKIEPDALGLRTPSAR